MEALSLVNDGGLVDKFLLELTEEARGSINKAAALLAAGGHLSKQMLRELNRVMRPAAAILGFDGNLFPSTLPEISELLEAMMHGAKRADIQRLSHTVTVCPWWW